MFIDRIELDCYDERFRVNLINSLSGFKSVNMVASQDVDGHSNVALFSSAFHVGATPPLLGLLSRPDSVPRDTLANIKATGQYTLNHVSVDLIEKAHQTSARLERTHSEFDLVGLTPSYLSGFSAPFVAESLVKVGLELVEIQTIQANSTQIIIGEVVSIALPSSSLLPSGNIDCETLKSVVVSGLDTYHLTQRQVRLGYAKAGQPICRLRDEEVQ